MANISYNKFGIKNDNYTTPSIGFDIIAPYLNKEHTIYEPFYCDGKAKEHLNKLGFDNVIHNDEDFFLNYDKYEYDVIVSNPPYSIKKKIFEKLKEIDKPWAMLVPFESLGSKFLQDLYKNELQVLIPPRRISFIKVKEAGIDGEFIEVPTKGIALHVVWVTYNLNLPRDLLWLD
jgi:hypothetical protein